MPDASWEEHLEDALKKVDELGVLDDDPMLEGDVMILLRSILELDLHEQGIEKLRRVMNTVDDLKDALNEAETASDTERQVKESAATDLEQVKNTVQRVLQTMYKSKQLGEITAQSQVVVNNKEVTVRSRFKPYQIYVRVPDDRELEQRLADHEVAKHIAQRVRDTTASIIKDFPFLIKESNATVDVVFTVKERARASILDGSKQVIKLSLAVTTDMLASDPPLADLGNELLIHELTHAYDDAQIRDKQGLDYELLLIQLRREGIATFAQNALHQATYQPTVEDTEQTLQDEQEPLPDDLSQARKQDKASTDTQVLRYAEGRHPYDAGKAMIDLMYCELLDKHGDDSKERRRQLLSKLRHYDEHQFLRAYQQTRSYFDLPDDAVIDAYHIATGTD